MEELRKFAAAAVNLILECGITEYCAITLRIRMELHGLGMGPRIQE